MVGWVAPLVGIADIRTVELSLVFCFICFVCVLCPLKGFLMNFELLNITVVLAHC